MQRFFHIFVITLILQIFSFQSQAQEQVTIKRKVAVVPLFNSGTAEWNYVSTNISDALRAYIFETNKYIILEPNFVEKTLTKNGVEYKKMIWEDTAVKIGELLKVDIVIYGFYTATDEGINIFLNALDVAVRKSAINLTQSGETGVELINTIKKITSRMSDEMLEKLPPYQKTISKVDSLVILPINSDKTLKDEVEKNKLKMQSEILNSNKYEIMEDKEVVSMLKKLKLEDKNLLGPKDFVQIGAALDANYILKIDLKKSKNKSVVYYQIADGKTGKILISKTVTTNVRRKLEDIFIYIAQSLNEKKFVSDTKKIIIEDNTTKNIKLSATTKTAIALIASGTVIMSGFAMLGPALGYYYPKQFSSTSPYDYANNRTAFYGLFFSGIVVGAIGIVLDIVSIPLFVIGKKKNKSISFYIGLQQNVEIGLNLKL